MGRHRTPFVHRKSYFLHGYVRSKNYTYTYLYKTYLLVGRYVGTQVSSLPHRERQLKKIERCAQKYNSNRIFYVFFRNLKFSKLTVWRIRVGFNFFRKIGRSDSKKSCTMTSKERRKNLGLRPAWTKILRMWSKFSNFQKLKENNFELFFWFFAGC